MTNQTAAARYARALLDVATKEQADLSRIESELSQFAGLLSEHPQLGKILVNPVIPAFRKRATVDALLAHAAFSPIVAKLIAMLAERDRLVLLPSLVEAYRQRLMDVQHVVRADVTTTEDLPAARATAIQESLARATGRTVKLTTHVDPSIVGGLVARVGSTVYDASVANHLQRLKQRLEESV